jgi:hypothetical protein
MAGSACSGPRGRPEPSGSRGRCSSVGSATGVRAQTSFSRRVHDRQGDHPQIVDPLPDCPSSLPACCVPRTARRRGCLQMAIAPDVPFCVAVREAVPVVMALRSVPPRRRSTPTRVRSAGTVALCAIDADPASGSALDGCRNPVFHVSTEHFSTRIWVLSVLRIGRRGLTQQCPPD